MRIKTVWLAAAVTNLIATTIFDRPVTGFIAGCAFIMFFYLSWICELLTDIKNKDK